jgi:hypothetical protein
MRKYIKIEFALRYRRVKDNGEYDGFEHGKRYSGKECTEEDFRSQGLQGDDYA